jgi:hypothetical protein
LTGFKDKLDNEVKELFEREFVRVVVARIVLEDEIQVEWTDTAKQLVNCPSAPPSGPPLSKR